VRSEEERKGLVRRGEEKNGVRTEVRTPFLHLRPRER